MDAQQNLPRVPSDIKFRVLVLGRANAGKTTILQRVCDSTESSEIYRLGPRGNREPCQINATIERGLHSIEDELVFENHDGYIFHDSRGFESGSEDELRIVQEFILRKSREKRLKNRLHAIWYCIPMDTSDRPELDLKHFLNLCPEKNDIPVIAVFTKYEQFRFDIQMKLEDQPHHRGQVSNLDIEVDRVFHQNYLAFLQKEAPRPPPYVRLQKMHKDNACCYDLIELTANRLSGSAVALMLLAVQRGNLELNINRAIKEIHSAVEQSRGSLEEVIKLCILAFPSLWYYVSLSLISYFRRSDLLFCALVLSSFSHTCFRYSDLSLRLPRQRLRELDDDDLSLLRDDIRFDDLRGFFERRDLSRDEFNDLKILFSTLRQFVADQPLSISSVDLHHAAIVTILILDYACISYAASPRPSLKEVLDKACSQYTGSRIHDTVKKQFNAPLHKYNTSQCSKFILRYRLS